MIHGEKNQAYAIILNNLGNLYYKMGEYEKAEPLFQQALDIRKEVLGENHPDYAASLKSLEDLKKAMGES